MKKIFFVTLCSLLLTSFILFSPSSAQMKSKEERISDVLDLAWKEYNVLAYSDLISDSKLYFVIDDKENKDEFQRFVRKNLDKRDLQSYGIEIEQTNEEKEKEDLMMSKAQTVIFDYLESDYDGISVKYTNDSKAILTLIIEDNDSISSEDLKTDVIEMLESDKVYNEIKNIPYEIQVEKL